MNPKLRLLAALAVAVLAIGLAACGSDSETTSGTAADSTSASGGAASGGSAEAEETSFSFGYSIPTGQNPWLGAMADTAQATAEKAGGEGELADSQLDPANAVVQINRFVSQGKDVVVAETPQVPEAIQASLTKAADAGSAVLAVEWSFADGDPEGAPEPPVQGQVNFDREQLGKEVAEAVNEAEPAGAKVIYVGLPFPVTGLDVFQKSMEGALGKAELIEDLDNPTDNAQGALGPLNGALAANPDATAIVTYNGPSALAAVQAVKAAGLAGKVDIFNIQLEPSTVKGTEDGSITASWDMNPIELGEALGEMMIAAGSGQPESEWAKTVVIEPKKYTKENIGEWKPW